MSKHLADHRTPSEGARLRQFINLEKQNGTVGRHPAFRIIAQRKIDSSGARRLQEFLRIERGITV